MYVQSTIFKTMMIERNQNSNLILVNMERKESPEMSIKRIAYETPEESVCCLRDEDARILTRRKRVFFYPEVIMIETLHHKNYTKEEKLRCWYTKSTIDSDSMEMKKELQRTVQLMKRIMNSPEYTLEGSERHSKDQYTFRGLENRINPSKRKLIRKEARNAVFQQKQTRNDDDGDRTVSISERYSHYTKQCAFEASATGLKDEVEAFRIANSLPTSPIKQQHSSSNNNNKSQRPWVYLPKLILNAGIFRVPS
mmetsp:Transcript_4260/g.4942  ORF Transcript_4260/g.4942 Transcript_4260/m.4942 type:complete len:253 (+) Transcript_4260:93-851(+)